MTSLFVSVLCHPYIVTYIPFCRKFLFISLHTVHELSATILSLPHANYSPPRHALAEILTRLTTSCRKLLGILYNESSSSPLPLLSSVYTRNICCADLQHRHSHAGKLIPVYARSINQYHLIAGRFWPHRPLRRSTSFVHS